MQRLFPYLSALMLVAVPTFAQAPKPQGSTPAQSAARGLEEYRADVQAVRADVLAKNLSLPAATAAKFWPMYEKFQAEQSAIMDQQLKGIQDFAANYDKMDDAHALSYLDALLTRDEAMAALRRKWLPQFQSVLPTTMAVRAMQIDRRLSLVHQLDLSSQIPLIR